MRNQSANFKRYYQKNLAKLRARGRQHYWNNRDIELLKDKEDKSKMLKYRYGIDYNLYLEIAKAQDYKCACCGTPLDVENRRSTVVDHDHETDDVRGLLCRRCNIAVWVLDQLGLLELATNYIERHNAKRRLHNQAPNLVSQEK